MDIEWAWATQSSRPGFCLTLVRDRDPVTVADLFGGGDLRIFTAEESERAFPVDLPGSLLRCGSIDGWAYCYEDRGPVGFQPSLLRRLSAGSEVVQVVKGGDGMNIARRMVDGQRAEEFEPRRGAESSGAGPAVLLPRVERILRDHPEVSGLLAALCAAGEHAGAAIARETLDGPLPTTISTRTAPDVATPIIGGPHGLGRRIATFSATGLPIGPSDAGSR